MRSKISASASPAVGLAGVAQQPLGIARPARAWAGRSPLPEFDDGLAHGEPPQVAEIELLAVDIRLRAAGGVERHLAQQFVAEVHQAAIIRVGLIELQHGELGVVPRGDAFVAEVAVDLVDPLQAAHHQPLQIQLRRDAQVEVDIQRVVMRDKRTRRGAAVERLHHGRFHFDEAAASSCRRSEAMMLRARHEDLAHFGIGDQIEIALAVAGLHVFQAVPFLGHGEQRLREEFELLHVDAQFAGAGAEQIAFDADDVAEIEQLEELRNRARGRRPS